MRRASAFSVALSKNLAHDVRNDGRQVTCQMTDLEVQPFNLSVEAVDPLLQAVKSLIEAIEPRFDAGEVVAVAPGLIEDVAGYHLLAFDLAFEHIDTHRDLRKLVPVYRFRHCRVPPILPWQSNTGCECFESPCYPL